MSRITDHLHTDHVGMVALLDILEREFVKAEREDVTNFKIMREVMQCLVQYCNAVHQPMEDLVYARLSERSPNARTQLAPMSIKNTRVEHLSRALRETVCLFADDGVVLRDELVAAGKTYVSSLRRQIEVEEERLFPLIQQFLDDSDHDDITRVFAEFKNQRNTGRSDLDQADTFKHTPED